MKIRHVLASQALAGVALSIPLTPRDSTSNTNTITLGATLYGSRFHAPTRIGNQTFNLLVDTGSSDTFVIADDFRCYGLSLLDQDELIQTFQSACGYEHGYTPSSTYEEIPDEAFEAVYGAGAARGAMAFEDIALGGITVENQKFGLVNWSTPMNIGSSGVLGLAYPSITSAFELNSTLDEEDLTIQGEAQPYPPLFVNMFRRGLVDPYFSLALNRIDTEESNDAGYMTLGGLPPVKYGNFTTVPAEYYKGIDIVSANGTRLRSYWATTVDRLSYGDDDESTSSYQTIVDTGAPMHSVPESVAKNYNDLFDPPAIWNDLQQGYIVDCDAKAPEFSVTLGGTTFTAHPDDLIIRTGFGSGDRELCLSAISPGLEQRVNETETVSLYILGAPFLKDVVSVFDFGKSQMRFAKRESGAGGLGVGMGIWGLVVFNVLLLMS